MERWSILLHFNERRFITKPILLLITLAACLQIAAAGSLSPPGAPAPTMKTLDEVESRVPIHAEDLPLVISAPGSYYLAGPITVGPDADLTTAAIIIESSYVTVDLNGFTLRGSNTSDLSGIYASGHFENAVIRNGHVTGWEEYGIYLDIDASVVESVQVAENHGSGISMSSGRLINCVVRNNGLNGVSFRSSQVNGVSAGDCLIQNCEVFGHGETGIYAARPVRVTDTVSSRNFGSGITITAADCVIMNSTFNNNSGCGILLGQDASGCQIKGNTCSRNREAGIAVNAVGCRIEENHVTSNAFEGLTVTKRSLVLKNTAYDNETANYNLVSEAVAGPIVTTTNIGTITSEHPWANLSYHSTKIGN